MVPPLLAVAVLAWAAIGLLALPPFGRPEPSGADAVIAWKLAGFVIAAIVLTDHEKPILLKRAASLGVVALFFYLFHRYSGTRWSRVQEQFFDFSRMDGLWELYAQGLLVTLQISVVAAALSIGFGLAFGILRTLGNPVLDRFLGLHVDVFRAMPLIVSMLLIFYALPFVGIRLPAFWAAMLALVLMNSAYQAEIFRAGIESVPRGQIDAAVAYVITVPELLTTAQQAVTWKRTPTLRP